MKKLFRAAVGDPGRLVSLVAARLAIDPQLAHRLVVEGRVEVNGKRVTSDRPITAGERLTAFVPDDEPTQAPLVVAYRDDEVLVVDKPAGLRSQAVRGDSFSDLVSRVQRELHPDATLLHRLDRETSGLVMFPTSNRARFRLQRSLDAGKIDRRYLALVAGRIESARDIDLRIGRDADDARRRVALPANDSNGEEAMTHVTPLRTGEQTLLRLVLETGRTHQLRVHLSAIGHPIVGDLTYGGPPNDRLLLHADALTFPDIQSGRPKQVTAAPPSQLVPPG